jgi:hypothetical protein
MITIYNGSGSVYQTILPNENDITYNDLIKYIKITKHPQFDEINFDKIIYNEVFIKTSIVLFYYFHHDEIKLDDEINENELLVMFKYKYYYLRFCSYDELVNDIKNYDNIFNAIKSNPYKLIFIVPHIENYEEICKFAVQQNCYVLRYVKNQTDEICKLAVQQNGLSLAYVKNQTDEICKLAVQQNGNALQYVKNQTDEICKLAIKNISYALKYVKNQTDEICKLAVKQNGLSLEFVKNQTEEICKLAVQQNGWVIKYVKNQTGEICKLAVQQNGHTLQYVNNQTEEICKLAIKHDKYVLKYIRDIAMREKIRNSL